MTTYVKGSARVTGALVRFLWETLTRFAKTVGCLCFVAGLIIAASHYQRGRATADALRYWESSLLTERLRRVEEHYTRSQQAVMQLKGATDIPAQFSDASFTPKFPQSLNSAQSFSEARSQLSRAAAGKDALKRFVFDRFELSTGEIERKLLDYSASIAPPTVLPERPVPAPRSAPTHAGILYGENVGTSNVASRREALEKAREFLGTLLSSAENAENKAKLEAAIAELGVLSKLLPEPEPRRETRPAPIPSRETTNAEKVAARLGQIRTSVREAILSSWALDEAFDRALQTLEEEQRSFIQAEVREQEVKQGVYLSMAIAIAAGTLSGLFFLLIGDWTQKASTEVLDYWCELVRDSKASPHEVDAVVESAVQARQVPGLECTRELWHEGGAVSAKREYLRFERERLCFEICAAPFGTGFFVSYRASMFPLIVDPLGILLVLLVIAAAFGLLVQSFGLLWGGVILVLGLSALAFGMRTAIARGLGDLDRVFMKTPLLGPLYELFLRPLTYYRIDSQAMYVKAVQGAVAESIESMFGEQGVRMAPDALVPPAMEELYRR